MKPVIRGFYGTLAQRLEQGTHNASVAGSIPACSIMAKQIPQFEQMSKLLSDHLHDEVVTSGFEGMGLNLFKADREFKLKAVRFEEGRVIVELEPRKGPVYELVLKPEGWGKKKTIKEALCGK